MPSAFASSLLLDMRRDYDARFGGAHASDHLGEGLTGDFDFNGDGRADYAIGAWGSDRNGNNSGLVYVVLASTKERTTDLRYFAGKGIRIEGMAGEAVGNQVASAGDVNGDGLGDLVIGSDRADFGGRNSGSAYVVFGKTNRRSVALDELRNQGFRIDGANPGDAAGFAVDGAGDVNGDGLDDIIVGALTDGGARRHAGSAYVVFGRVETAPVPLSDLGSAGFAIYGGSEDEWAGRAVSGAGDFNGDGLDDVVVGAPFASYNSRSESGSAYVVLGSADTSAVDLAKPGSRGFRIDGSSAPACSFCVGNETGFSVDGGGDVNADGLADVVVGAPFAYDGGRGQTGAAYVIFGRKQLRNIDLADLGCFGYRLDGQISGSETGQLVAFAGDVDNDGSDDVAISAPAAGALGRRRSGLAYLVHGKSTSRRINLGRLNQRGYVMVGARKFDTFGGHVANAGDLNGDGRPDLLIGAPLAAFRDRDLAGKAYVVFGRDP